VWLDCVDCCAADQLFVGAGTGAPDLIMEEAGLVNVFANTNGSWACVNVTDVVAADADLMVVVDASWDSAVAKIEFMHNHSSFCTARVVREAAYITIPFSASTLGPRNGAAALDMASVALHLTGGGAPLNFKSGVSFIDPDHLQNLTTALRCPFSASTTASPELVGAADSSNGDDDDEGQGLLIGLCVAAGVAVVIFVLLAVVINRERGGAPIFTPLENGNVEDDTVVHSSFPMPSGSTHKGKHATTAL
jgi:hypothetical protein